MSRRIISVTEITEILYQWCKGISVRKIAESLGNSRNTIRVVIAQAESLGLKQNNSDKTKLLEVSQLLLEARNMQHTSGSAQKRMAACHDDIKQWLIQKHMTIRQIQRLLAEPPRQVIVSEMSLHRYIKRKFELKPQTVVHLETIPGEQGQVDFGYVGLMLDPITHRKRRTQAFVMTLSHSRYRFVYFVFKQDTATWIDCHKRAFAFFGGVPKTILLDNLKAGVLKPDIYDPTLNPAYAACARHYNFIADPAKVRTPTHKGKVERSILIVKQQVISGRNHQDSAAANQYAQHWARNIIANEVTRTTGETPRQRFTRDEQAKLLPLPATDFECPIWQHVTVSREQHVVFKGSFYSVPTQYVGEAVTVCAKLRIVEIYHQHTLIKTHIRANRKGEWITDVADIPDSARHYLDNNPGRCRQCARTLGESVWQVINAVLSKCSTTNLRKAQAIIRLADPYGADSLDAACRRAIHFNNIKYAAIKSILQQGLQWIALPSAIKPDLKHLSEGAFLRSPSEFLH